MLRTTSSPRQALLDFCETTYDAAAELAKWDRAALERTASTIVVPQVNCRPVSNGLITATSFAKTTKRKVTRDRTRLDAYDLFAMHGVIKGVRPAEACAKFIGP